MTKQTFYMWSVYSIYCTHLISSITDFSGGPPAPPPTRGAPGRGAPRGAAPPPPPPRGASRGGRGRGAAPPPPQAAAYEDYSSGVSGFIILFSSLILSTTEF